jgi:CheY-like chemotaxis protein
MPIVALSGHEVESLRERAMAAGMDDVLSKLVDRSVLIATCQQLIHKGAVSV